MEKLFIVKFVINKLFSSVDNANEHFTAAETISLITGNKAIKKIAQSIRNHLKIYKKEFWKSGKVIIKISVINNSHIVS